MISYLNHVAILVESIESYVAKHIFDQALLGEICDFDDIGTRELYIGRAGQTARLLLIEGHKPGPYQSALAKRGPGLHHVALDVLELDQYVEGLSGTAWLLHPKSLGTYNKSKEVYLCRPGVPSLIELVQVKREPKAENFINKVKFPSENKVLVGALGCKDVVTADSFELSY